LVSAHDPLRAEMIIKQTSAGHFEIFSFALANLSDFYVFTISLFLNPETTILLCPVVPILIKRPQVVVFFFQLEMLSVTFLLVGNMYNCPFVRILIQKG
jgi:hypothetical protein